MLVTITTTTSEYQRSVYTGYHNAYALLFRTNSELQDISKLYHVLLLLPPHLIVCTKRPGLLL